MQVRLQVAKGKATGTSHALAAESGFGGRLCYSAPHFLPGQFEHLLPSPPLSPPTGWTDPDPQASRMAPFKTSEKAQTLRSNIFNAELNACHADVASIIYIEHLDFSGGSPAG